MVPHSESGAAPRIIARGILCSQVSVSAAVPVFAVGWHGLTPTILSIQSKSTKPTLLQSCDRCRPKNRPPIDADLEIAGSLSIAGLMLSTVPVFHRRRRRGSSTNWTTPTTASSTPRSLPESGPRVAWQVDRPKRTTPLRVVHLSRHKWTTLSTPCTLTPNP